MSPYTGRLGKLGSNRFRSGSLMVVEVDDHGIESTLAQHEIARSPERAIKGGADAGWAHGPLQKTLPDPNPVYPLLG
jgi:hypothetical protein